MNTKRQTMKFNIEPTDISSIKLGQYVLISNQPCKIVESCHSTTGKHGHTKVVLVGIDVLTSKKLTTMAHGGSIVQKFKPLKCEYQLLDLTGSNDCVQLECLNCDNLKITLDIHDRSNTDATVVDRIKTDFKRATDSDKIVMLHILYAPVQVANQEDPVDEFIITGTELTN